MPLASVTLRNNLRLRDCLIKDSAHVTPGSRGEHVSLIQKCLLVLEKARLAPFEIESRSYGPTTAAAVLSYKRKRRIINPAYQQDADNIVGKMTIERLDKDIARVENSQTNGVGCSEHGAGRLVFARSGPAVGLAARPVGAPGPKPPVKLNRKLAISLQRTASTGNIDDFVKGLVAQANKLMAPHALSLVEPVSLSEPPISYPDAVVKVQFPVERFAVRKAAVNVKAVDANVLRVIFCPFDPISSLHGFTDGGPLADDTELVPRFVLINTSLRNPDLGTLLHEMCHAAFPEKSPTHDGDATSVYSIATSRTQLPNQFAAKLAESFFKR